jgi:hypothetical protein
MDGLRDMKVIADKLSEALHTSVAVVRAAPDSEPNRIDILLPTASVIQRASVVFRDHTLLEIAVSYNEVIDEFELFVNEVSGDVSETITRFIRRITSVDPQELTHGKRLRDIIDYSDIAGLY